MKFNVLGNGISDGKLSDRAERVKSFLDACKDGDLLTTKALGQGLGQQPHSITSQGTASELPDYTEFAMLESSQGSRKARIWGNKKTIKAYREQG